MTDLSWISFYSLVAWFVADLAVQAVRLVQKILRWREVALWRSELRERTFRHDSIKNSVSEWYGSPAYAALLNESAGKKPARRPAELDDPDRRKR